MRERKVVGQGRHDRSLTVAALHRVVSEPRPLGSGLSRAFKRGQSTFEFVIAFAAVIFPATFALVFTSQLLWVWHTVNEFTRQGASYASTHCWDSSGQNVLDFMQANIPPTVDTQQFQNGPAQINITYLGEDPNNPGQLVPFPSAADCSISCVPDTVTVSVNGYQYGTFVTALGLPPVTIPNFETSLPMESTGYNQEQPGACVE